MPSRNGYYPAPPQSPGYGYQSYDPGGDRIGDLILQGGQIAAQGAQRSGEIWGGALSSLGQIGSQAVQQYGVQKEAEKENKRSAAWTEYALSGAWAKDPKEAYREAVRVWGPGEKADKHFQALAAQSQLFQPKRDPEADAKAFGTTIGAMEDLSDGDRAKLHPHLAGLAKRIFPDVPVNEQYDPNEWPMYSAMGKALRGEKAGPGHVVQTVGPDGRPIQKLATDAELSKGLPMVPPKPETHMVQTTGPNGGPVNRLATAEELAKGVPGYRAPTAPRQPNLQRIETVDPATGKTVTKFVEPRAGQEFESPAKAPPQQRLTKEERQDFASWNYSLPRLEKFAAYVKSNPDKWGKFDAFAQDIKRQVPGFVDSDYTSQKAFVARLNSEIRHALFGAALTEGEKESANAFLISEKDQPEEILAKLQEAQDRGRSSMGYYRDMGFNLPETPAAGQSPQPRSPYAPGAQRAPVRVSSPAEAAKLPRGTPIILPDGTLGKVP